MTGPEGNLKDYTLEQYRTELKNYGEENKNDYILVKSICHKLGIRLKIENLVILNKLN